MSSWGSTGGRIPSFCTAPRCLRLHTASLVWTDLHRGTANSQSHSLWFLCKELDIRGEKYDCHDWSWNLGNGSEWISAKHGLNIRQRVVLFAKICKTLGILMLVTFHETHLEFMENSRSQHNWMLDYNFGFSPMRSGLNVFCPGLKSLIRLSLDLVYIWFGLVKIWRILVLTQFRSGFNTF